MMTVLTALLLGIAPAWANPELPAAPEPPDPDEAAPASPGADAEEPGQEGGDENKRLFAELKDVKQPGLGKAVSKIYSADQRWSLAGFGEVNSVTYLGPKNEDADHLETIYTNIYRSGTYFGYKLTDRVIFNSELQVELLHDRFERWDWEANFEAMVDILITPTFNIRFGNYPMPLGYININEDPVAFYTVNRPEVERIIIPTQWLDQGIAFYGILGGALEYQLGLTKGLNADGFEEETWIRHGRSHKIELPDTWAVNGKLELTGVENLSLAVAGYSGTAGGGSRDLDSRYFSRVSLATGYAEYRWNTLSVFGMVARGWMTNTDDIFANTGQILGSDTLGYYGELRWNVLAHLIPASKWEIPLFARFERLQTHLGIDPALAGLTRSENDLEVIALGANIRPHKHLAIKTNYMFRNNRYKDAPIPAADQFEVGVGFIY